MNDRRQFALLIDSDNISAKYIDAIIGEISAKYGDLSIKRIYGDWTNSQSGSWRNVLLTYSLKPVQQFRNTVGKNATDSTLIIDAMDILYEDNVDGFCIVSSDSDFTSLAQRLGESGKMVIGMGEEKTPLSFRNACRQFVVLENLVESDSDEADSNSRLLDGNGGRGGAALSGSGRASDGGRASEGEMPPARLSRETVQMAIEEIVRINDGQGYETKLADLGNALISRYPDFDVRAFGYSQLSKFVNSFDAFSLMPPDAPMTVSLNSIDPDDVRRRVSELIESSGDDGCSMAYIGQVVKREFPTFRSKDAGYAKLKYFLRDIPGLVVVEESEGAERVYPAE